MRIPSGTVDQYIYFVAVDSTDFTTRETGLTTFTVYRSRNGGTSTAMTTPTINETDTTNMPGVYELLLDEDMTIDTGDDSQEMVFHITHTGMAPVTRTIELYRPKITAGETLTVSSGAVSTVTSSGLSAAAVDAIWDESTAAHTTANTMGWNNIMAGAVLVDTTITGTPTSTTVQLTAGSSINDFYNDQVIHIASGTGVGQARIVSDYVGATKTITVDEPFITTPAAADRIVVHSDHIHALSQITNHIDANSTQLAAIVADTAKPQKNVAYPNIAVLMVDSTDHVTPKTALTLSVNRSLDGAAFGAATGTAAEISNGIYQFDASAADMNADVVTFRFSATGADDAFVTVYTRP